MSMDPEEFYTRVKTLVKDNKVTIEYIVGKAGLTIGTYNGYRRHKNLPRADEAILIAQALGTTAEYLVFGKEPEPYRSAAAEAFGKIEAAIKNYKKTTK